MITCFPNPLQFFFTQNQYFSSSVVLQHPSLPVKSHIQNMQSVIFKNPPPLSIQHGAQCQKSKRKLFQVKLGFENPQITTQMTHLLPACLGQSYVSRETGTNQESGFSFLLSISKLSPLFQLLSQNSPLNRFSFLHPKLPTGHFLRHLCQLTPLLFLSFMGEHTVHMASSLQVCSPVVHALHTDQNDQEIANSHICMTILCDIVNIQWYFICITHLIQIDTHTHTQTGITSTFHMRLNDVKNLTHFKELLSYRAKIQMQGSLTHI